MKVQPPTPARFAPPGKYLWDPWFMGYGEQSHCFFLEATRNGDTEGRTRNLVSVGHAISKDLYNWDYMGTILSPGKQGSWDGLSILGGHTIYHDQKFYLFYTGCSKLNSWTQQIGLAISSDLTFFERFGDGPLLDHKHHNYEFSCADRNPVEILSAWKDPHVFRDNNQDRWIMIFSAKSNLPGPYNACIGMAVSKNLLQWEVLPPILEPGIYAEMTTPQLYHANGLFYLFFSTMAEFYSPDTPKNFQPSSGMHGYVSDTLEGPYKPVNRTGSILANGDQLYSVRMAAYLRDRHMAIGWLNWDGDGDFIGKLSTPLPMMIEGDVIQVDFTS